MSNIINTNSPNRSYIITEVNNNQTYKIRVAAVNSIGTGPFTEYVFATPEPAPSTLPSPSLLLRFDGAHNSPVVDSSHYSVSLSGNSFVTNYYGDAFVGFRDGVQGAYVAGAFLNRTVSFADLSLDTGSFTFEGWLAVWANQGYANNMQIFANSVFAFQQMADSSFLFSVNGSAVVTTSTIGTPVNTYTHVALVRNGNSFSIYANGTRIGTGTTSASLSGSGMVIGSWARGFMDQVRIVKAVAYSGSSLVVPSSPFVIPPGAPTGVTGSVGNAQVSLSWTAPANNGGAAITDYVVQYSSDSGSSWTTFSDGTSTATSATVMALTNGTAYVFRVAAVNSVGTGSYSATSNSATPSSSATVPGAPTNVVAHLYSLGAGLNWTDPASNGGSAITGYVVQFSQNGGSWTTTTLTPLSGYRGYFDGDNESFSYTFRVAAVNGVGTGSFSSPSSAVGWW